MVIDFHGHVGSWDSIGATQQQSDILRAMDFAGVDTACVFNIFHSNVALGNRLTAQFVSAHPDRFIGFGFVTPHYPEDMERELLRAVKEFGMKGIKIYPPYFDRSVEDPIWEPVFAFAHARKLDAQLPPRRTVRRFGSATGRVAFSRASRRQAH